MVTFSRIETSTIPSCYPKHYARKPICFECYVQEIFACDGADFVCFEEKCVFHFVVCVMDVLPTLQFLSLFFYDGEFGFNGCANAARLWGLHGKCTSSTRVEVRDCNRVQSCNSFSKLCAGAYRYSLTLSSSELAHENNDLMFLMLW